VATTTVATSTSSTTPVVVVATTTPTTTPPVIIATTTLSTTTPATSTKSTLTVSTIGTGKGTLTSTPAGINCGNGNTKCNYTFPSTATVSIKATPSATSDFKEFSGDCSGLTCSLQMYSDKKVYGEFTLKATTSTLNATTVGAGVRGTNPGVASATYGTAKDGAKAVFIPMTDGHSTMFGYEDPTPYNIVKKIWDYNSYNAIGGSENFPLIPALSVGVCSKIINDLVALGYPVYGIPAIVRFADGKKVSVRIDDSGDDRNVCPRHIVDFYIPNYEDSGGSSGPYGWLTNGGQYGTSITGIDVYPSVAARTGGQSVNSISGEKDWEYRSRSEYDDNLGWGIIKSSPTGINCGADNTNCTKSFSKKQTVTLTANIAKPKDWFVFSEWRGDCTNLNDKTKKNKTCKVNMSTDKSVTAQFLAKYKKR